jgi:drug/metabolite transporter (DMT)-like permease
VDAFHLTAIRYTIAAAVLLGALALVEGRSALRLDGRGRRLLWLGTLGFAGFNLLVYVGLSHAQPQSAALITALAPLLTGLVVWLKTKVRPAGATFISLAVALVGVALVISRGHPSSLLHGSLGWGDGLVLGGVLGFVLYTIGYGGFREFSPLRYTALTAGLGWLPIAGATAIASITGLEPTPTAGAVWSIAPQLVYITLLGAAVAVVAWNAAVGRIGPANAALFSNLTPITAFVIEIARGYRAGALELAGAGITVAALVAANLVTRRRSVPRPQPKSEAAWAEAA